MIQLLDFESKFEPLREIEERISMTNTPVTTTLAVVSGNRGT
jgi:hypothetical protein